MIIPTEGAAWIRRFTFKSITNLWKEEVACIMFHRAQEQEARFAKYITDICIVYRETQATIDRKTCFINISKPVLFPLTNRTYIELKSRSWIRLIKGKRSSSLKPKAQYSETSSVSTWQENTRLVIAYIEDVISTKTEYYKQFLLSKINKFQIVGLSST